MHTYTNETEFYLHEVATWGQEYIESLIEQGYTIVATDRGYGWLAPNTSNTPNKTRA